MSSAWWWLILFGLVGCAAPFEALKSEVRAAKLVVKYCGSSAYRSSTVIAAMDGPPSGEAGKGPSAPAEATVCVSLENAGTRPVRVNRNSVRLRCRNERYSITADRDDERFVVPPGTTRTFKLTFAYGHSILSGEDAELRFEDAITEDERSITIPSLILRRR